MLECVDIAKIKNVSTGRRFLQTCPWGCRSTIIRKLCGHVFRRLGFFNLPSSVLLTNPEISWRSPIPGSQTFCSASWEDLSRQLHPERESDPITDFCKFVSLLLLLLEVPRWRHRGGAIGFALFCSGSGGANRENGVGLRRRSSLEMGKKERGKPSALSREAPRLRLLRIGSCFCFCPGCQSRLRDVVSSTGKVLQDLAPLGFPPCLSHALNAGSLMLTKRNAQLVALWRWCLWPQSPRPGWW